MQGFFLGLASGATCVAYCAPVLVPLLLGEGRSAARSLSLVAQFLGGRLVGYLLFGLVAWGAGSAATVVGERRALVFGVVYALLAASLLVYGLVRRPAHCAAEPRGVRAALARRPALFPAGLGLLTGLNVCPPFLLALASAADRGTLVGSVLFFLAFFAGTSVYVVPLAFVGALSRFRALQTVGKLAAICVGLYYLYLGATLIAGGMAHP